MKIKELIKNIVFLLVPSFLVIFLLFEAIFRFIIPANESVYYHFDDKDRVMKISTEYDRDGLTTLGPLAQIRAKWHVNNDGWNSNIDYMKKPDKPVIAVFGASVIEATQVNVDESLSSKLNELVKDKYYVYNFGIAGSFLSNMLQTSRYANKHYDPKILVFNVTSGIILPSLCANNGYSGFMCLEEKEKNIFSENIRPYVPKSSYRLLRKSAVVRYLFHNVDIAKIIRPLLYIDKKDRLQQKPINDSDLFNAEKDNVERLIDHLLNKINDENKDKLVIFMYSYDKATEMSKHEFNVLKRKSDDNGFHFVDLTKRLAAIKASSGKKIDFGFDSHWNAFGHESIANVLYEELMGLGFIK